MDRTAKKLEFSNWMYVAKANNVPAGEIEKHAADMTTQRHVEMGVSWQTYVAELIRTMPPGPVVVVETGVYSGLSTFYLLSAIADRGPGSVLASVDPLYKSQNDATNKIVDVELRPFWKGKDHILSNWKFFAGKSRDIFPQVINAFPEWDVFIHDSDHSKENMIFELETALKHVKPGGFIVIDDFDGTDMVGFHKAFVKWVDDKGFWWTTVGNAAIFRKDLLDETVNFAKGETVELTKSGQLAEDDTFKTVSGPELIEALNTGVAEPIALPEAGADEVAAAEAKLAEYMAKNPVPDLPPPPKPALGVYTAIWEISKGPDTGMFHITVENVPGAKAEAHTLEDGENLIRLALSEHVSDAETAAIDFIEKDAKDDEDEPEEDDLDALKEGKEDAAELDRLLDDGAPSDPDEEE
jgi:predicted O-methyltransferase YrrM